LQSQARLNRLYASLAQSQQTKIASRQHVNTVREAIKIPRELKTASAKAMWIVKSVVSCEARDRSLDSASCESKIIPGYKTISALHRAKPLLSREAKGKAFCANSEATAAPLTPSAVLDSARLVASGKIKALSAQIASSCKANSTLCRVQPRLSRKVKAKAPMCANSVADSVSLPLTALSAKKVLSREARTKELSAKDLSRETKNEAPLSARLF